MTKSVKRIEDLSPEQRDLLMRRLAQVRGKARDRSLELKPQQRGDGVAIPLSFSQESAWFLDRLSPGDPAHNIAGALRLEGALSPLALTATIDEIFRRHETLRANFHTSAEGPTQVITAPRSTSVAMIDLSNLPETARASEHRRLYTEESRRGFDLTRDSLLRATLIRLASREHFLMLTIHHIAADGWSVGVLMGEIAELYAAGVQGKAPRLGSLPIQYGDFAIWQRQRLRGDVLERELGYWRQQLEGLPPVLELPPDQLLADSEPAAARDLEGATCFLPLDRKLKESLDKFSREQDTTLFATFFCAYAVLLMRWTGHEDFIVGSPVSGRIRVETEQLVGAFVNTLALRAQLSRELTFRQALSTVRKTVLEGLEHHEVPLERIVQDLDPERRATGQPLFASVFNFTPSPTRLLELPDLSARMEEPPEMRAKFAMELSVTEWQGGLELRLLYPQQRYSEALMACFLDQLQAILEQAVRDPDRRLGSLDLATPRSRALLPDPTVALDQPAQKPVAESIVDWARRSPEQPAISRDGATLTYAQLATAMNVIAESLRSRGLEPGQVVAVLGPRSPGVVVSMASVFLTEGVLLTLSPDLPAKRHRLMLQEAEARFLLYVGDRRDEDDWLDETRELEIIPMDLWGAPSTAPSNTSDSPAKATEAALPSIVSVDHRSPAYLFFTSGSTGKPKGVLGTHVGLAHFLAWQRETFTVGPGDRCAQLTGLSFDVVLRDIFLPLTSGATLVLPTDEDSLSGESTLQWLESEKISLTHTVPAVVEMWLISPPAGVALASLRCVFFAGEPLTAALVGRWRAAFGRAGDIINLYGPTETTLAKCYYRVPARPRAGIQPLGTTLPQTQALVLTPERELCGLGEPGEIALRTPFRTLGFINAEEANAERFIPNPWRAEAEDKLYLSGDRGAYTADGLLEIRGRLDHQVKVRGVRVEPTEVAVCLEGSPDVAACAVIARLDGPDGTTLVAYVVLEKGADENTGRLQEFLRKQLPAAMVPAAFVFLDSLPLTSNQKLDRERLPAPSGFRPSLESTYVAPRDATELQLVQLWEDMLDVRPIGVTDSFFELGGHSLMALNLLAQIDQRLGLKIALAALFESPTIEHLATVSRQQDQAWPIVVKLWSAEHPLKLFLVHPGGGILWNYIHLVRHLAAPVPIYGLQAQGLDGASDPHRDLESMAAAYVAEVRQLQPKGPYLLAGHSFGGMIAFEMARQLRASGDQIALLAMFDSALTGASAAAELGEEDERQQDAHSLVDMVATVERFVGREIGVSYEALCNLSADDQISYVLDAFVRSDTLPLEGGIELTRNLLNVSKAHVKARRAYHAKVSSLPITLFRARDGLQNDGVSPAAATDPEESLGWQAVSSEPVRVLWTPGDHVTMMSEPDVEHLARSLNACLADVIERAKKPTVGSAAHAASQGSRETASEPIN